MTGKSINAELLKSMFISASNNLFNCYPEIDALNVFPVPDGDTGMNMNLTLSSGVKEIQNRNDDNVFDLSKAFSKGLLMGARGNSGVITSQIFRGFSSALEGKKIIKPEDLLKAFSEAKNVAYKAVINPVEGTILTVVRESSDYINEHFNKTSDIETIFKALLKEATASLKRTPELLPVLKEAGVVDSGATGYVKILEGMWAALDGKFIEKNQSAYVPGEASTYAGASIASDEFGYCTEFILKLVQDKKTFFEKRFINTLLLHGNSLELVHDDDIVKVHVHTLTPGFVLTYAQQFGEFLKLKIDNMTEEHHEILERSELHEQKKSTLKKYGLIACSMGDGVEEMFKDAGVDVVVKGGQTMNPSTEDFVEAIKSVNAKNIYILPNNSNIVMAASQACDVLDESINAQVIPSSTIPQGLAAAMEFNPDSTPEENLNQMKAVLKNVKSASITYAIKNTVVDGVSVKKNDFMALVGKKIIAAVSDKFEALKLALASMVDDNSSIITILCGDDIKEDEMNKVSELVESTYEMVDLDIKKGGQPIYSFIVGVE
jgi:DAK2 domain fusion protein YloV